MIPPWLHILAIVMLLVDVLAEIVVAWDLLRHPQRMAIMNVVWPITMLYAGPVGLWAYFRIGRLSTRERMQAAQKQQRKPPSMKKPFWQMVGLVATQPRERLHARRHRRRDVHPLCPDRRPWAARSRNLDSGLRSGLISGS